MIISRAQSLFCYVTLFAVLLSERVSGWSGWTGWWVAVSIKLQWLEWAGMWAAVAGVGGLACDLRWLEWVGGWVVCGGWHVSCNGLSGMACELEWVGWHVSCSGWSEWAGMWVAVAGVGGLACELQWLEWVGGLAAEWWLACELQWLEWVGWHVSWSGCTVAKQNVNVLEYWLARRWFLWRLEPPVGLCWSNSDC